MSIEKVYLKYDSSITEEMFNDLVRLLKDNGYEESDHLGFTNNFATFKHNHYRYLRIAPYDNRVYFVDNHAAGNSEISYKELINKLSKDEFKVGDWVAVTRNGHTSHNLSNNPVFQITGIKDGGGVHSKLTGTGGWICYDAIRKALPHEIPNSIDTCKYVRALSSTGLGSYTKNKVYKVRDRDNELIYTEADNFNSDTNGWGKNNFKPATKEEYEAQQSGSEIDKYIGKQFTFRNDSTIYTINKLTDKKIRVTWDSNEDNYADYSNQGVLENIKKGVFKIKEDSIDTVDPYRGINKAFWIDGSVQWVDLTDPHSGVFTTKQDRTYVSPDKPIIVKREKTKRKLVSLI